MALRLTRLPTQYTPQQFQLYWQQMCEAIEAQQVSLDNLLAQFTGSLTAGQLASDAAGSTAKSGEDLDTGLTVPDGTWVSGPSVTLTGVTSDMRSLTLTGSGPVGSGLSGGPFDGEYRILEGAAVIFSGHFSVRLTSGGVVVVTLPDPVNTTVYTRSGAGSVTYHMELRRVAGAGVATGLSAYLFARRGP